MVGMFPPPLHGMSLINEYVRSHVAQTDAPYVIDFSPRKLDRSLFVRAGKLFRVAGCFAKFAVLMARGHIRCVYFGLSGGNGQIYDALFVGMSRLFRKKLYLHHHSYLYLNCTPWAARWLMTVAGKGAVHIVACEKMAADLKRLYPTVIKTRVISGIAALEVWDDEVRQREKVKSVGFLSNISAEKGVFEFLEVAERAGQDNLPLRFVLAGPYHDDNVKARVEERIAVMNNLVYTGAVYGVDKQAFFDSIDVFLLPSHNESEGLVIHEAMSRGVPVIAYSRGCIEQIISEQVGLRLHSSDNFAENALNQVKVWLENPSAYQQVSHASLKQFLQARALHVKYFKMLCAEFFEKEIPR